MTSTDTTIMADGPGSLAVLRMAELREIVSSKGTRGISAIRKYELIKAIKNGAPAAGFVPARKSHVKKTAAGTAGIGSEVKDVKGSPSKSADKGSDKDADENVRGNDKRDDANAEGREEMPHSQQRQNRRNRTRQREQEDQNDRSDDSCNNSDDGNNRGERNDNRDNHDNRNGRNNRNDCNNRDRDNNNDGRGNRNNRRGRNNGRNNDRNNHDDDGRGNRNRRNRHNRRDRYGRDNNGGGYGGQNEIREDDVLRPVAGIVGVLDNRTAFVRTSGCLPGSNDVSTSAQVVRRYGLHKGDAATGQIRMPRESGSGQVIHGDGRSRRKYNPLIKVETVNGLGPKQAKQRPNFAKLTLLYPDRRLHLETEQKTLTTRVIDLITPIGKDQRALIVSPPRAGRTTVLQNIANAIMMNNPECYMMVVLVDERPEEIIDMQHSVRGEVIVSTFDRPPSDRTTVAELAIERVKRLMEQGQDVIVLFDFTTHLGRAYNSSLPASERILSDGADSSALYPPKRFLGAARSTKEDGSLTVITIAMMETGSTGDTVIFEEFKGTGSVELKLNRKISERHVSSVMGVNPSGTHKGKLLLNTEEAHIMHKLRRILSALESQAAINLLVKQSKETRNNKELLMQVASSAPVAVDVDVDDMLQLGPAINRNTSQRFPITI